MHQEENMAAHSYDQHTIGSLLQNTHQLHRHLNRGHPGVTEQSQQAVHDDIQKRQYGVSGETQNTVGLGLVTTIGSGNGGIATTHSHVTGGMSRSFSSSSLNGQGSPRPKAMLASPPNSTPSRPPSGSTTTSSPTKPSFYSPQLPRLPSASTFASYHDRPQRHQPDPATATSDQVGSSPTDKDIPSLSVDTTALPPPLESANGVPYSRHYTKSLTAGTYRSPHLSPQPHTRRPKNSLSALANIDLNGRFAHHLLGAHNSKEDNSTISINVRFVSKDLWIRVEIPRNISVLKARDLVLEKCQLSMTPPSAPSSLSGTALPDDDSTATIFTTKAEDMVKNCQGIEGDIRKEIPLLDTAATNKEERREKEEEEANQDPDKMPTTRSGKGMRRSASHSDIKPSHSEQSLAKSTRSDINTGGDDKMTHHSSLDEQDLKQKAAAALVARLEMFSDSINGFGDEIAKINNVKTITSQSQPNSVHDVPPGTSNPGPNKVQQLKRLVSNSSIHNDDNHSHGIGTPDRSSREVGTSRLGHISGWNPWRDRNNSHSGKYIGRDTPDLGDMSADWSKQSQALQSEASKKELDAWRATFGLFWVAGGHWLDDSRTVSSYPLQPQHLLELQVRDHYIHLPPPGGFDYQDHYAEGTLFKLSKKSRPVSMLTSHGGKESLGVWKERWVVLHGSKLLIYHKRKDTTKKTIELPIPLHVALSTLQHSRQFFKVPTQSAATMSSTMIALTMSSDPHMPKLCFRGTSDHDMNHWIRIFNSLNNNPGSLPAFLNTGIGPPNLDSLDFKSSGISDSSRSHTSALASYSSERKRNHTLNTLNNTFSSSAATVPSIDPVLISNAAVAISNLTNMNNSNGNSNNGTSYNNSSHHHRHVSQATNIGGSVLDNRDLNLLQHHHLTTLTKEDTRRRATTEPNRFRLLNAQHSRGSTKNGPQKALEVDTTRILDLPGVSEAPFRLDSPPGSRKRRPVLGTEYLDNASQVLLATSSARSSMAPIYSGYVWIYVPNVPSTTREMKEESDDQENQQPDLLSTGTVLGPSATSPISSSRTVFDHANNSGDSASASAGRYVKCFAAISDQGHFHWVEVKKQNDLESEQELKAKLKGTASRSSYGIQLKPKKAAEAKRDLDQRSLNGSVSVESCPLSPESISGTVCSNAELIQVSVAHRLRLFFFCIKITPSMLTGVLLNIVEATTGLAVPATGSRGNMSPSIASTATNAAAKAANKIRHRLSSSLSTLTASALPPLPSMKSQSLSGSVSKGKSMGWPTVTSPHDGELASVAHHSQQQRQQQQQQQNQQHQQNLHPERSMSAPSESVRPMSHKNSSISLKSTPNITTAPTTVGGLFPNKDGDQQQQHTQFASPTSAEPASPSSSSSSSSSSNVISLAQNLQKAVLMNRGQSMSSDGRPGSNGNGSGEYSAAQSAQSSPSNSTKRRQALSEATVANQSALPDSAETLEQTRLLQEHMDTPQHVQRAEERPRAKFQQYNLQQQHQCNQQQHHQQSQQSQHQQYRQQQQNFQCQESSKIPLDTSNSLSINSACPFLEMSEDLDGNEESFVTLKGYTETEDGWRALQNALERFLDGPINEHISALPPEDTLIPSYHSPPEVQLSEKAQRFLSAKGSLIGEVNHAESKVAIEAGRAPTPDIMSAGMIPALYDPMTQTRSTSSSLTRWMHLSGGGGGTGGGGGGGSVDRGDKNKKDGASVAYRQSPSSSSLSLHTTNFSTSAHYQHANRQAYHGTTPLIPVTSPATTTGASNTVLGSPAQGSKRGVSPTNPIPLSVGFGANPFRPRPRLNQQRSADELSKVIAHGDKESGYASGHHHNPGQTLYSTAADMMHSVSAGGIESNFAHSYNHNNINSSNINRQKPSLKGSRGPFIDEDCYRSTHGERSGNSSGKEKETSEVAAAFASLSLPPKSTGHHFSPSPKTPASPNPGYTAAPGDGQLQDESRLLLPTTTTSTQLVKKETIITTSAFEGLLTKEADDNTVDDVAKGWTRKGGLYSLYSHPHMLMVQEGGESTGNGSGFAHEKERMSDQRLPLVGLEVESSDLADSSQLSASDDHLPSEAGCSAFVHVPIEEPTASTSASGKTKRPPGSGQSNKKHQTVLGASKAAVSGVLGKFRKSVG